MRRLTAIALAGLFLVTVQAQEESTGSQSEAIKDAEQALTVEGPSAEGYFNLGLAFQKNDQPVEALLNYQRALVLDPGLKAARNAMSALAAKQHVPLPPRTWQDDITAFVHPEVLVAVGSTLTWVGMFVLLFTMFSSRRKSWVTGLGVVAVLVGSLSFATGWVSDPRLANGSLAMVMAKDGTELRTAPTNGSSPIVSLPAGSPVGVLSPRGPWTYVALGGGAKGWVPTDTLQPVVPGETL